MKWPVVGNSVLTPMVSGSAIYLLSNILIAAIPFALLPVLTRYLSPGQYGQVAMFQTLVGALGAFVGVGVAAAVTRKHYDMDLASDAPGAYVAACLQVVLATAVVTLMVLVTLREPLAAFLGLNAGWILGAVFVSAAGVVVQVRLAEWQVRQRALSYGAFQLGQSLVTMLLSLVSVVLLLQGADGRIGAQSVTMAIFAVVGLILLRRDGMATFFVWRPAYLKEIVSYGVPLIPHVLAAFVLFSVDRLVINGELGLSEAGVYMVAVQLAGGVSLVFDAIGRAYTPWLYEQLKRNEHNEKRQIVRSTYAWFLLILVGALAAFFVGPPIVTLIAGERYAAAGTVIGWLVLGQAFFGMYLLFSSYLMFGKRTGLLSFVTVSSALIYIALLAVLVPAFGLKGAAIGFAVAMALRLLLTWWAAHKSHPMPWLAFRSRR